MEIINSKLIGTGACIPDFVLTNAMLEKMVDTNDEWIVQRTGVRERRIAKNTHTWELALGAAQDALADAGIAAEELDLILVSTCSPDTNTPNTASILQDKLGARQVGAFDINNACTGFVSATDIADSYIKSGKAKTVLVVSAETLSRIVDYTDRSTCILFGDGAAAAVYQATEDETVGILSTFTAADGSGAEYLHMEAVCRGEGGQNADRFVLSRLINGCSGTVAEQNAGRAVGVVHDARKRFRRDNQYGLCLAGFNVTVRNVGRGDKAGAGIVDIERADLTRTQLVLQDRRRIRRVGIRRAGADENEVKLLCSDACVRECVLCGTERQLPCMCILCDAALAHTGALHDPLIVGIDHFFQHGVGQDKIRNAGARADQFTVDDFHAPKKSKSLSQKAWKSDNS